MTWGIFKSYVLLPTDIQDWDRRRIRAVLLHEFGHIKRGDVVNHVLLQIVCAIYWFNPLVWFAAWRVHVERERACDDLVLRSGIKASE